MDAVSNVTAQTVTITPIIKRLVAEFSLWISVRMLAISSWNSSCVTWLLISRFLAFRGWRAARYSLPLRYIIAPWGLMSSI